MHTTNYYDTFIQVADDSPAEVAEVPPLKEGRKTAANIQFDLVYTHPYKYTSDEILFAVFAEKNSISSKDLLSAREKFFSKGQPCLRSSPLAKRYGWGLHSNDKGQVAIYPVESVEYNQFLNDEKLKHVKAMRSKRG